MEIPKEISSLVNKALYRLSMGDMTCEEMMVYLTDPKRKNTGFPKELAEKCVSFLVKEGYLDDKRYLKWIVRKLDRALVGPRKIRETLVRHRFPPGYVEAALNRDIDYVPRAQKLLESKKKPTENTMQARKKQMDFLVRQGYDWATARSAMERVWQETDFSD